MKMFGAEICRPSANRKTQTTAIRRVEHRSRGSAQSDDFGKSPAAAYARRPLRLVLVAMMMRDWRGPNVKALRFGL